MEKLNTSNLEKDDNNNEKLFLDKETFLEAIPFGRCILHNINLTGKDEEKSILRPFISDDNNKLIFIEKSSNTTKNKKNPEDDHIIVNNIFYLNKSIFEADKNLVHSIFKMKEEDYETCKSLTNFHEKRIKLKSIDLNSNSVYYKFRQLYHISLKHAPTCPCEHISTVYNEEKIKKFSEDNKYSFIKMASVALITDKYNNVLITRRNKALRTFPACWIFPGGNKDKDEDFFKNVLRELKEEVGLDIVTGFENGKLNNSFYVRGTDLEVTIYPLMYYESTYPIKIENGEPIANHFITFFYIKLHDYYSNINLTLQPEEVDAYAWIDKELIARSIEKTEDNDETEIEVMAYVSTNEGYSFESKGDEDVEINFEKRLLKIDLSDKMSWGHKLAFKEYTKRKFF